MVEWHTLASTCGSHTATRWHLANIFDPVPRTLSPSPMAHTIMSTLQMAPPRSCLLSVSPTQATSIFWVVWTKIMWEPLTHSHDPLSYTLFCVTLYAQQLK